MLQFRHDSDDSNKKYADEDKENNHEICRTHTQRPDTGFKPRVGTIHPTKSYGQVNAGASQEYQLQSRHRRFHCQIKQVYEYDGEFQECSVMQREYETA